MAADRLPDAAEGCEHGSEYLTDDGVCLHCELPDPAQEREHSWGAVMSDDAVTTWAGECCCGWKGEARFTCVEALADGELHATSALGWHPVSAAVSPAEPPRRRITVTHTHSATFVQAEVDAVWNSGVLPIPNAQYVRADDPDARAIAVFEALDGSLLELFYGAADDDTGYEVEDYDPEA